MNINIKYVYLFLFIFLFLVLILQFNLFINNHGISWESIKITCSFPITSYPKCKFCSFKPNPHFKRTSTRRDAIFTFANKRLFNLIPFIQTLRTTGCICRFLLFIDNTTFFQYSQKFFTPVYDCGIEIINIGNISMLSEHQAWYKRHVIFNLYLKHHKFEFDRIIFCDLFDTVFQHDPFSDSFLQNILYVSSEGYKNKRCSCKVWIKPGIDFLNKSQEQYNQVLKGDVINGGIQAGSPNVLLELTSLMIQSGNPKTLDVYVPDQGFLNIIIFIGPLNKKVNISIIHPDSDFISSMIHYTKPIDRKFPFFSFGNFSLGHGVPAIIHQYDRSKKIKKALFNVCPNNENWTDYTR